MTIACRCSMALVQSNNEGKNIHVHFSSTFLIYWLLLFLNHTCFIFKFSMLYIDNNVNSLVKQILMLIKIVA